MSDSPNYPSSVDPTDPFPHPKIDPEEGEDQEIESLVDGEGQPEPNASISGRAVVSESEENKTETDEQAATVPHKTVLAGQKTIISGLESGGEIPGGDRATSQTQPSFREGDTAPLHLSKVPKPPPPFGGGNPSVAVTPKIRGRVGSNQPLPHKVSQNDLDATRVSGSAYSQTRSHSSPIPRSSSSSTVPSPRSYPSSRRGPSSKSARVIRPPRRPVDYTRGLSCLLRLGFASVFVLILVALCGFSILFYQYYSIAQTLPSINDLRQRTSQFETTRILDREGNVLYEILDPNAGRRTYVPLEKISPYLVAATIATEDKGFYSHPGFDVMAIGRAFLQNYQGGETISGASTITQQLARSLLFTPEERFEQTYQRKVREAILAAEITRRYSKDEILEIYLNENNYGNLAYGIEAAAQTYFGTTADKLNLGQASFLAGLPQAPAIYDVYTNPDATFDRHEDVLVLMFQLSQEQGCIYVSNHPQRICVDPVSVTKAAKEIREYQFQNPDIHMRYPHWVTYVRSLLEEMYDPQTIYRSGFNVYTTLDPGLQQLAQDTVSKHVATLAGRNAQSGALVAIRPNTGEILAMVGSADFYNEGIDGQVNMAINPRQPGSAIKPLTYLAGFEKGLTPSTLIWDVPSEFTPSGMADDPGPVYKPTNYDDKFHGPVSLRSALANSYNVAAVKALQFIGIYDDPNQPGETGLIPMARRLGITTLNRPDYGLSLTLGGGEVTLLELAGAYATLANNGWQVPTVAITRIEDYKGNVVFEHPGSPGQQVVRPEHAYLITSILSDNRARTPAFGSNSVLNLPFQAAVKTGTTNDVRDNWTVGYNPDLTVGVWVGNPDYSPMRDTSGVTGAAPIWSEFMQTAIQRLKEGNPTPFSRPPGIVEHIICEPSGTFPSQWCPSQATEIFAADQPPLPKEEDLWQKVAVDTWTELKASPDCAEFTDERFVLNVSDPWAKKWIMSEPAGRAWAERLGFSENITFTPTRECTSSDPRPFLQFAAPRDGETIDSSPLNIYAIADATQGFASWQLEYGLGENPAQWQLLEQSRQPVEQPDMIHSWDLIDLPPGVITLRLVMQSRGDTYAEKEIRLHLNVPTPTPTPTPTMTPSPTPTNTPLPSSTPTSSPSPTPTNTPIPSSTQEKFPKATTQSP